SLARFTRRRQRAGLALLAAAGEAAGAGTVGVGVAKFPAAGDVAGGARAHAGEAGRAARLRAEQAVARVAAQRAGGRGRAVVGAARPDAGPREAAHAARARAILGAGGERGQPVAGGEIGGGEIGRVGAHAGAVDSRRARDRRIARAHLPGRARDAGSAAAAGGAGDRRASRAAARRQRARREGERRHPHELVVPPGRARVACPVADRQESASRRARSCFTATRRPWYSVRMKYRGPAALGLLLCACTVANPSYVGDGADGGGITFPDGSVL